MTPECTTLHLTPAECAEYMTPVDPAPGSGWLALAMLLALVLVALKLTDME